MTSHAMQLFGSGWVWLSANNKGQLYIEARSNAGTPLVDDLHPLIAIDVWEHAYYIDHRNARAKGIEALWKVLDWSVAEARYRKALDEKHCRAREKTGVFTGAYATHPLTGKKLPVYLADYVLYSYGTGAVMAVAAHDERDYAFAKKYGLPVTQVIQKKGGETILPFCEDGILVNSGAFDGLSGDEARDAIAVHLTKIGKGGKKVNYRLRDWSVSRQRYWGAPIPMIHCEKCGAVPVPEKDLPVKLPYDVEFRPSGKSPLAAHEGFMKCTCPKCGGKASRDPDTLDTFVCSSWFKFSIS